LRLACRLLRLLALSSPYYTVVTSLLFFLFLNNPATPEIYTFPTRRSSDLAGRRRAGDGGGSRAAPATPRQAAWPPDEVWLELLRSEEHTSELQSLTNLVCRLLLEKKKT